MLSVPNLVAVWTSAAGTPVRLEYGTRRLVVCRATRQSKSRSGGAVAGAVQRPLWRVQALDLATEEVLMLELVPGPPGDWWQLIASQG